MSAEVESNPLVRKVKEIKGADTELWLHVLVLGASTGPHVYKLRARWRPLTVNIVDTGDLRRRHSTRAYEIKIGRQHSSPYLKALYLWAPMFIVFLIKGE